MSTTLFNFCGTIIYRLFANRKIGVDPQAASQYHVKPAPTNFTKSTATCHDSPEIQHNLVVPWKAGFPEVHSTPSMSYAFIETDMQEIQHAEVNIRKSKTK